MEEKKIVSTNLLIFVIISDTDYHVLGDFNLSAWGL